MRIVPIYLEVNSSLWFYFLPFNSIFSLLECKNVFRDSFEDYDIIEIHQNYSQMQVHDGESIQDFNTHFRQGYYSLNEEYSPSTQLIFPWYFLSFPNTMAMFILREGITYFNKACKETQDLEKYLKRYPFNLFSPFFLYDVEYVEDELIIQSYRSAKDLCNEFISIKKERHSQNALHDLKQIVFSSKIQSSLDTKRKLVANSNLHFSLSNVCRYDECFTYSLYFFGISV